MCLVSGFQGAHYSVLGKVGIRKTAVTMQPQVQLPHTIRQRFLRLDLRNSRTNSVDVFELSFFQG